MNTQTATELIVKCLENEGVDYIFGVPGEENMDLLDALLGSSIRFIMTRHEQGAAFMADVYGRLTGKAGVCLSTLGPGGDESHHRCGRCQHGPRASGGNYRPS